MHAEKQQLLHAMGASTTELERVRELLRVTTEQLAAVSRDRVATERVEAVAHSRRRGSVGNVPPAPPSALDQGGAHRRQSLGRGALAGGQGGEGLMNLEDTRCATLLGRRGAVGGQVSGRAGGRAGLRSQGG